MANFKYSGYDSAGKKVSGVIEAADKNQAQLQLRQSHKLMVSSIEAVKASGAGLGGLLAKKSVAGRDLEYLTSEIMLLLKSGVKFDKAVALLAKAKTATPVGDMLSQISVKLKAGSGIAQAFGEFGQLFNQLYINLLKIGEESGALTSVFEGLSQDLKYRNDLRQTIVQATTYPFFILLMCVASVLFIFNIVVPEMAVLFVGVEDLSLSTRIVLSISDWLMAYQLYLGVGLIALVGAALHFRHEAKFVQWFHRTSRQVIGVRTVVEMSERIRFCTSMALLLKAGIAMDQAVKLSAGNSANLDIKRELAGAGDQIRQGTPLSQALAETSLFSDLFVSLIGIGEESGEVTQIFAELAARSRNEFNAWVSRMTAILEPVLIVTMGLIIGAVVVTMMLSVMSINNAMI